MTKYIFLFLLFPLLTAKAQYTDFGNHRFFDNGVYSNHGDTVYNANTGRYYFGIQPHDTYYFSDTAWNQAHATFFDTLNNSFGASQSIKYINTISNTYVPLGSFSKVCFYGNAGGSQGNAYASANSIQFAKTSGNFKDTTFSGGIANWFGNCLNEFAFLNANTDTVGHAFGTQSSLDFEPSSAGHIKRYDGFASTYNYYASGPPTVDTLIDFWAQPDPLKIGGGKVLAGNGRHYHFYGSVSSGPWELATTTQNPYFYEGGTLLLGYVNPATADTNALINVRGLTIKKYIEQDYSPFNHTLIYSRDTIGNVSTFASTTTEGTGLVSTPDTVRWTSQTASISAQNFSNTGTGYFYRAIYYLYTTTAGSAGTAYLTLNWNDGNSKSVTSGTIALTAVDLTGEANGDQPMVVTSGTPTWSVTVTGNVGAQYALWITLEKAGQ